jgi:hypothetical protein
MVKPIKTSAALPITSLPGRIPHVVQMCAEEKTLRIDATRDIASVADFESLADGSLETFV